jgi:hypothetical protein
MIRNFRWREQPFSGDRPSLLGETYLCRWLVQGRRASRCVGIVPGDDASGYGGGPFGG